MKDYAGNDIYCFGRGYGQDVLDIWNEDGEHDAIRFQAEVASTEVVVTQAEGTNDLVLSIEGTDDRLTVFDFFHPDYGRNCRIDSVEFADGTVWDFSTGDELNNIIIGNAATNVLMGLEGNDTLRGEGGADILLGGLGNDTLRGGTGPDLLDGGDGNDSADYRDTDAGVTVNLASGIGTGGTAEGDTLLAIEHIYGSDFDDTLIGSDQNNTLLGFGGNDLLSGGPGNDTLRGGTGPDLLDGGDGNDSADYRDTDAGVTVNLATGIGTGGTAEGDTLLAIEHIYGSDFDDTLTGSDQNNTLLGLGGNDLLSGGPGNDTLRGGTGPDLLDGGDGNDSADYRDTDAGVTVNLATGIGTGGTAEGDTLLAIEHIYGSDFDDTLIGSDQNNTLLGLGGNDLLSGLGGNDILRGGTGPDLLDGGDGNDSADYRDTDAGVTVNLASGIGTGGTAEGDTLLAIEHIYGSDFDDSLTGSDQDNTLLGLGGNDLLSGLGGNDILRGGTGLDLLDGGDGNDSADYRDTDAGITVNLATGIALGGTAEGDTLLAIEHIYGSDFDDSLTGSDEDNTLLGLGGNDLLSGLEGNDTLRGEGGADILLGGLGNDTLRGGTGPDLLDGSDGNDSADYRDTDAGVTVNLASGIGTGGTAEGDTLLAIEHIYGSDFDDTLTGSDQNNTLLGLGGNDLLAGGLGNDTLTGGMGNDIFVFDTTLSATTNKDILNDFVAEQDKIQLDKSIFTALTEVGTLSSAYFTASATGAAADTNDYFLYNITSGALLYDADGSGQGMAVQFATLTTKPQIAANDLLVVA